MLLSTGLLFSTTILLPPLCTPVLAIKYTISILVQRFWRRFLNFVNVPIRPNSKAMSPNFISGRNIKQAGKCSKGSLFREWINSESDNRQRKLGSFASSKKRGAHIVFLQHSTLTRHLNLADYKLVILATSLPLREHGSMREKKTTPQSRMMLLNCVNCMVSEYLPLPKFKSLIVQV